MVNKILITAEYGYFKIIIKTGSCPMYMQKENIVT